MNSETIRRRDFLRGVTGSAALVSLPSFGRAAQGKDEAGAAPVRAITRGPRFHWFGYYDKLQVDPTGRYALGMEVDFEHRSPRPDDTVRVGMVDLRDNDRWVELGTSRAWNWQQGCMLQWRPGHESEVIWNDRQDEQFVSYILDVRSGKKRTLPHPVYALSPDGRWAVNTDFRRLNDTRPGYGYCGVTDPNRAVAAPEDAGIWRVDLETGEQSLLLSLAQAAQVAQPGGFSEGAKHWFNHLLVAPDGRRFTFLHRWQGRAEGKSWKTRMFTAGADGRDLHLLIPSGKVSHFIWRDPSHILAYAGYGPEAKGWRFQVFEDLSDRAEVVEGMPQNDGHCTYLPGRQNQWILCDSYPDKERRQHLYLLHVPEHKLVPLGRFLSPREYTGEWRCDTHPRPSPDGRSAIIDSPHGGNGRQMYLVDLSDFAKA
jgi:hypothetical protein